MCVFLGLEPSDGSKTPRIATDKTHVRRVRQKWTKVAFPQRLLVPFGLSSS